MTVISAKTPVNPDPDERAPAPQTPWFKPSALGISGSGNYWEISDDVFNRIEGGSYLENKMRHNEFLKDNPFAAKRKFINLH